MKLKMIDLENFNHYKKPSMVLGFPKCTFKCDKECGEQVCQNGALAAAEDIEISNKEIWKRYSDNHITQAIVCAGLEPFDSLLDLVSLIMYIRGQSLSTDIVIYTGYTEEELCQKCVFDLEIQIDSKHTYHFKNFNFFNWITKEVPNIIIKFGRFIPNQNPHFDDVLGVYLASDNQYAKEYNSDM